MRRPLVLLLALLLAAAGTLPSLAGLGTDMGADARKRERPGTPAIVSHPDAVRSLPTGARDSLAGWYIVELDAAAGDPGAVADEFAARDGAVVGYVYRHAIRGFAAKLDAKALKALKRDGRVRAIVADVAVAPPPRPVPGAQVGQDFPPVGQTVPVGVARIQAPENPFFQSGSVDVDVAVIDTGVDGAHPDLGVAGGVSCVDADPLVDGFGHGTHVAGTIGALDNGIGVIGVAPGARLWSVQVLDESGSGSMASVVCGIDWVTANAGVIEVANMSLGGYAKKPLEDGNCGLTVGDPEHVAICASVAAGVTYVVAAGNDCMDTSRFAPAAYDEVITVGAMIDTDGQPGAYGFTSFAGQCDRLNKKGKPVGESGQVINPDDAMASFSNVGAAVDIWAPGVEILSTFPADLAWSNRPYVTLSGTSMASPHVAGAAALVKAEHPGYSPAQVQQALLDGAEILGLWNPYTGFKWNAGRGSIPDAAIANVNPAGPWPASE